MDIFVGTTLFFLAGCTLARGVFFAAGQNMSYRINRAIVLMSLFAVLWCGGYGWMTLSSSQSQALAARAVGLLGILGYLSILGSVSAVASHTVRGLKAQRVTVVVLCAAALADWVFFSRPEAVIFTTMPYGTCFYTRAVPARLFHTLLILSVTLLCIAAAGLWLRRVQLKRERLAVWGFMLSGLCMVLGAVGDTLLPMLGRPSFPGSPFGAFVAYIVLCHLSTKYNTFSISVENTARYIYEKATSPVLVFSPDGRVALINDFGLRFFRTRGTGQTLTELFDLSDADATVLLAGSTADANHTTYRLTARQTQAVCAANFSPVTDHFGSRVCTLCFVYNLSREEEMLEELLQVKAELEEKLREKAGQMECVTIQAITAVAKIIDAKDEYTRGHSVRVSAYAGAIARELGWDETAVQNIRYIGLLHDIGKIGVPDSVMNSPGSLSGRESELMKSHTVIGGKILKDITVVSRAAEGAKFHHERYDGGGYPCGLAGEEIPPEAQVICVADAYDAMTSNRSFRKHLSREEVRAQMEQGRGTQFAPAVLDAAVRLLDSGGLKSCRAETVRQSSSEAGLQLLERILSDYETSTRHSADKDYLTGLWSRHAGERKIIRALQEGGGCLAILDLDNLKQVNDIFGHPAGDRALKLVGAVLSAVQEDKIAARMGGDEFLFFLRGAGREEAERAAEGLIRSYNSRKQENGTLKSTSFSMGLCLCEKNEDYASILARADQALYHVKQHGKSGYAFYHGEQDPSSGGPGADFASLVSALRQQGGYSGVLNVEYREFSRLYEYITNLTRRSCRQVQLLMLTLETDSPADIERQERLMGLVEQSIRESLRKIDVCTRYSRDQYLVILVDSSFENVDPVARRIDWQFHRLACGDSSRLACAAADLSEAKEAQTPDGVPV